MVRILTNEAFDKLVTLVTRILNRPRDKVLDDLMNEPSITLTEAYDKLNTVHMGE